LAITRGGGRRIIIAASTIPASQTVDAVANPSAEDCASAACDADATTD
jgi:hypothetical protein